MSIEDLKASRYYKAVGRNAGYSDDKLKVASHSWGFIADTDEEAIKKIFPSNKTSSRCNIKRPSILATSNI